MSSLRPRVWISVLFMLPAAAFVRAQSVDPNFNPGADTFVYALAAQSDGRILVGGAFRQLGGTSRNFIGRLNPDGSLDSSFATTSTGVVQVIVIQPDARIVIAGQFTNINGQSRSRIARLNADGSLDATFDPGAGSDGPIRCLALQPDGKIVLGGGFQNVGGRTRNGIARLNSDGSLDLGFNPDATGINVPGAAPGVFGLDLQPDGKIVFGGQFVLVSGQTRNGLARVNADGSLEGAFNPSPAPAPYESILVLPGGKILVGGGFSRLAGPTQPNLARLNADGSVDGTFAVAVNGAVPGLFLQSDGSVLISGFFSSVGGQPHARFARLNRFGIPDAGFNVDLVTSPTLVLAPVSAVVEQPDGRIVFGGDFNSAAGVSRANLARLTAPASSRLVNLSTRGFIAAGADLTVGFGVRGGTKPVLVRGVGPTLSALGVTAVLPDPRLEAIPAGATSPSAANDDWNGDAALSAAFVATGAFALNSASKDSALMTSLTNNTMTARVTSAVTGASGIALAEVYDRDPAEAAARLINLSTLGFVGTGTQALIPGFTISGGASKRLLIRAVGPGLAAFGVGDALADPQITLVLQGSATAIENNDNWGADASLATAFTNAGAFALSPGSKDAALVTRLPPGSYTVVVSGVGGTTGRALVEIYDLDP